ncbi:MAG TPA: hypothetical protein VL335_03795 [Candidatus Paceibacterota bacterium]|nr:hypothetical protein [Candidatus Paceibacterota bacterium]
MQENKSFTIENIPLTWITLGGLIVCASILLSIIYVTKPLIHRSTSNAVSEQSYVLTAQAHASDSAGLYPPQ